MILICGGLVTYGSYQFQHWASAWALRPLLAAIDESHVPAAQKSTLKQNIARTTDEFQQGRMSYTQMKAILQSLYRGSFLSLLRLESLRYQYLALHPVIDAQHGQTMLILDRFERGVAEKTIPPGKVSEILALLPGTIADNDTAPGKVTEADFKPAIEEMRKTCNTFRIPSEPYQPDFAAEIDQVVAAVMGTPMTRPTTTSPATSGPATTSPAAEKRLPTDAGVNHARITRS